jgi:hypothetical protein
MDQFCKRCGAADGYDPDDHDCLGNLNRRISELSKKHNPHGYAELSKELSPDIIFKWEREVSEIYEHMREITIWYSDRVEEAEMKRDNSYNRKQTARVVLTKLRAHARELLADPER